jgi:hypothetical protein
MNIKKNQLRSIAKEKTDLVVIEVAQGISPSGPVTEADVRTIRQLFREILGNEDLSKFEP